MAYVVLDVEARIVDPQRPARAGGRDCELLAVARQQVQAPADVFEHVLVRRRGAVEQQQTADVHMRTRALLMQEAGVRRCQPIQMLLGQLRSEPLR